MEQIRQIKKLDMDLFQVESICQNRTDEELSRQDEILRLEDLYRLSERIIDIHNVSSIRNHEKIRIESVKCEKYNF